MAYLFDDYNKYKEALNELIESQTLIKDVIFLSASIKECSKTTQEEFAELAEERLDNYKQDIKSCTKYLNKTIDAFNDLTNPSEKLLGLQQSLIHSRQTMLTIIEDSKTKIAQVTAIIEEFKAKEPDND